MLPFLFSVFTCLNWALPLVASAAIIRSFKLTSQQYKLMKSFSLLLLGMFLSSLATLNFSLALLVGLLTAPLTYVRPLTGNPLLVILGIILSTLAPTTVLYMGSFYWDVPVSEILREAAFGWNVWGMNTQVVVWCVWWPAWLIGSVVLL